MKRKFIVALLLGLFCFSVGWAQDADPSRMSLDQLSSNLLRTLEDSKSKIVNLQNSLTISLEESNHLKIESELSKAELNQLRQTLSEQSKILTEQSNSLLNINQELTSSLRTIENYKIRLEIATKWITGLAIVCVLFLALKVVAIVLRVKFHIRLPWIIDVLV